MEKDNDEPVMEYAIEEENLQERKRKLAKVI